MIYLTIKLAAKQFSVGSIRANHYKIINFVRAAVTYKYINNQKPEINKSNFYINVKKYFLKRIKMALKKA